MSNTATALRKLHRIHRQISDLRGRLARGPKQLKAGEAHLKQLEEHCARLKESLTQTRVLADDKQLQLRHREDRISDLQRKLNSCGSNREYQALTEQIAADKQANSVLSDEILEALDKIERQESEVTGATAEATKAKADLEALRARVVGKHDELEAELNRVTADLEQAEATLPAEFKSDYQRITKARGENALAPVEDETCSACYHRLTAQTMNELLLARPVFCQSCGAVLYLPEDTSPVR